MHLIPLRQRPASLFRIVITTQHVHKAGATDPPVTLDTDGHWRFASVNEISQRFRLWQQVQGIGFTRLIAFA